MGDEMPDRAEVPRCFGKELVACFGCRLIKARDQFRDSGCENCSFLDMQGDMDRVYSCTTGEFSGIISVMDPAGSWATKWKHLSKAIPGCYALGIHARMDPDLQDQLENHGITWHKVVT
mmetsp:Transcript_27620/g.78149  ORF Transcript_27620/g.78149 Transcript_27620/m.78149 type:complete len:119 (-) Transcript_27620:1891-2247(-)